MNLLPLRVGVVAQQGLRVLPAGQAADIADTRLVDDVEQGRAAAVAVDGALDVRRLDLAARHLDLAVLADEGLAQVQRIVVVLRVAQHDGNVVARGAGADLGHLGAVDLERVFDVVDRHFPVNGALPVVTCS